MGKRKQHDSRRGEFLNYTDKETNWSGFVTSFNTGADLDAATPVCVCLIRNGNVDIIQTQEDDRLSKYAERNPKVAHITDNKH